MQPQIKMRDTNTPNLTYTSMPSAHPLCCPAHWDFQIPTTMCKRNTGEFRLAEKVVFICMCTHSPSCTWMSSPVMSTLLLYTHISSFSMIFNIRATFGSIIRLGQYCRMCFEPLAIYPMSFRPFPTIFDDFRCFYRISDVCSLISDLSLHRWTIYAFPIL